MTTAEITVAAVMWCSAFAQDKVWVDWMSGNFMKVEKNSGPMHVFMSDGVSKMNDWQIFDCKAALKVAKELKK